MIAWGKLNARNKKPSKISTSWQPVVLRHSQQASLQLIWNIGWLKIADGSSYYEGKASTFYYADAVTVINMIIISALIHRLWRADITSKGLISWKFTGLISMWALYRDGMFSFEFTYVMRMQQTLPCNFCLFRQIKSYDKEVIAQLFSYRRLYQASVVNCQLPSATPQAVIDAQAWYMGHVITCNYYLHADITSHSLICVSWLCTKTADDVMVSTVILW